MIKVSYIEIYNEKLRDLLIPIGNKTKRLRILESPKKGIVIMNVTTMEVFKAKEIMNLLYEGNKRRKTESTKAN